MKKLLAVALVLCLTLSVCAVAEEGGYSFPYTGDPITVDYFYVDFSYAGMDAQESYIAQKFFDKLGNVEWNNMSVGWGDYSTKWNLFFSSGDVPDIIFGSSGSAAQYAASGLLLNYHDYEDLMPNYKALYETYPQVYNWVNVDGEDGVYSLHQPRTMDTVSHVTYINYQMVEEKGYTVPTTWDEMVDLLRQVKADYPDAMPFHAYWSGYSGDIMMQYNTWNTMYYNFDTEAWEYGPLNEGYKAYVELMNTLYTEGLIHEHYYDMTDEEYVEYYHTGNFFLWMGYNELYPDIEAQIKANKPGWHFDGILPLTAGDNPRKIWLEAFRGAPCDGVMTAADTENPEFMCSLLDYLVSDEIGTLVNWGVEGETFTIDDNGEKHYTMDVVTDGGTPVIEQYGITPHFMIKMGGLATQDDWYAMNYVFGQDQTATRFALENRQLQYLQENPDCGFYVPATPPLNADEADEAAMILTDINTYCDEQTQLFIMGKRDLAEWDAFISELEAMGDIDWLCETYNSYEMPIYVNE